MTDLLSEAVKKAVREEPRFRGIQAFRAREAAPPLLDIYEEEVRCVTEALQSGAACAYVDRLEEEAAGMVGVKYGVALGSGTAALHLALRLAAERTYGTEERGSICYNRMERDGLLRGRRVFCSDLAPAVLAAPVIYEGGEPVFIDASCEDWGMDPEVLETAFGRYPDVKIVMLAHLYGFPGQAGKIKEICERHGALLIEDACESLGTKIQGKPVGGFGDYGVLSFHDEEVMPGIEGGMLLANECPEVWKVRNRMGEAAAGIIRSRLRHLEEYINKKKAIYERYEKRFSEDLMMLNPIGERTEPSYRTPCMTVESSIGFIETRSERDYEYISQHGTAAPMEILEALAAFGAAGKPVWKPLHMQPLFKGCDQITLDGSKKEYESSGHSDFFVRCNESGDIFRKGICLPTDVRMTEEEQDRVMDIILGCYSRRELNREIWCV